MRATRDQAAPAGWVGERRAMMRNAAAIAFLLASGGATSADPPDWSGPYAGISALAATDAVRIEFPTLSLHGEHRGDSYLGATQVGYNWQLASGTVLGLELDFEAGRMETDGPLIVSGTPSQNWNSEVSEFTALRLRVGWQMRHRSLGFLALGPAGSELEGRIYEDTAATVLREKYTTTMTGWTVALGAERLLHDRFSVLGQIRHSRLGTGVIDTGSTDPFTVHAQVTEVRVGFNYHF